MRLAKDQRLRKALEMTFTSIQVLQRGISEEYKKLEAQIKVF